MRSKEVNKTINNLKKYVEEDNFYSGEWSVESDFDAFCYNHCLDINRVLNYISELKEDVYKLKIEKNNLINERDNLIEEYNKTGEFVNNQIYRDENYINKQIIRDKIKELEEEKNNYFEKQVIQGRIDLLKELLDGE